MFPRPDFFSGSRLNFAENLLFPAGVQESQPACITLTEADGQALTTTWAELREAVRQCSHALRAAGVRPKDVVAGFVSNHVHAIVAMLGAAALGAVWTGISPDNGVSAVLDRLAQIEPKVLFADNGMLYNGKSWPSVDKTAQVADQLKSKGLELVVVINNIEVGLGLEDLKAKGVQAVEYESFLKRYDMDNFGSTGTTNLGTNAPPAPRMPLSSLSNCLHLTHYTYYTPVVRLDFPKPLSIRLWVL